LMSVAQAQKEWGIGADVSPLFRRESSGGGNGGDGRDSFLESKPVDMRLVSSVFLSCSPESLWRGISSDTWLLSPYSISSGVESGFDDGGVEVGTGIDGGGVNFDGVNAGADAGDFACGNTNAGGLSVDSVNADSMCEPAAIKLDDLSELMHKHCNHTVLRGSNWFSLEHADYSGDGGCGGSGGNSGGSSGNIGASARLRTEMYGMPVAKNPFYRVKSTRVVEVQLLYYTQENGASQCSHGSGSGSSDEDSRGGSGSSGTANAPPSADPHVGAVAHGATGSAGCDDAAVDDGFQSHLHSQSDYCLSRGDAVDTAVGTGAAVDEGVSAGMSQRCYYLQKKLRTLDTPMCSTYYVEFNVAVKPFGDGSTCRMDTSVAIVWLATAASTLTLPLRRQIESEVMENVRNEVLAWGNFIGMRIAHLQGQDEDEGAYEKYELYAFGTGRTNQETVARGGDDESFGGEDQCTVGAWNWNFEALVGAVDGASEPPLPPPPPPPVRAHALTMKAALLSGGAGPGDEGGQYNGTLNE